MQMNKTDRNVTITYQCERTNEPFTNGKRMCNILKYNNALVCDNCASCITIVTAAKQKRPAMPSGILPVEREVHPDVPSYSMDRFKLLDFTEPDYIQ